MIENSVETLQIQKQRVSFCSLCSCTIDATANTDGFPSKSTKSTKTVDKQASGPHTYMYTLGREFQSPVQMADFELMTYT